MKNLLLVGPLFSISKPISIPIPCSSPTDPSQSPRTQAFPSQAKARMAIRAKWGNFIYVGVSSPYGTLTVFRQNTLRLEGIVAYDPMGGSNAFSPIGTREQAAELATPKTAE